MGDRILELRKGAGCATDAFFHRLNTLDSAVIEADHDYLVSAIVSAINELGVHEDYAREIIAHIQSEKQRVVAQEQRVAYERAHPCIGTDGRRHAAFVRDGVTITD